MSASVLGLLQCPFCGGSFQSDALGWAADEIGYGVLACYCSKYPIVAGIPIIKKGVIGAGGQQTRDVVRLIEAGQEREALMAVLLPPPPVTVVNAPVSIRAARGWQEHAEALFTSRGQEMAVCDLLAFYYGQAQVRDGTSINSFLFRFSMPRYPIALSLCSVISQPARPILDLACGIGQITASLIGRAQGQRVVGLDRDFFYLYIAKNWLASEVMYVCGDADALLPFPDGAFSAVFCSDAVQLFENKVNCIRELKRLTGRDGIIILSALPTVLETHPSSLPPQGYQALVADMPHRLVPSYDILSRYLQKQGPSLRYQAAMERVSDDPWVSIIASHDQTVFRDYGSFSDWPHARGSLRMDPLYKVERRDEFGCRHFRRVFPSRWFEHENAEYRLKEYLPETVCITEATLGDLSKGHRTPEVETLLGQCVVVGFPDGYLPADYCANQESTQRLEAAIGGAFYIEQVKVSDLITAVVPPGNTYIMVDEGAWDVGEVSGDRRAINFFERDGQYWGPPADGEAAIRELERLRETGATFIIFGLPAVWWLAHYADFGRYLYSRFRCVLQNDHLMIFDLRSSLVM